MTLRAFLAQHGEDVRASLAETLREQTRLDDDAGDDAGAAAPAETSAEKVRKRGRAATAAAAMLDAAGGIGGGSGAAGAPPCTPADRGVGGGSAVARAPGTTRGPRRGEVVYSRDGSPLGAPEDGDGSDDEEEASHASGLGSCVKRVTMTSHKRRRVGPGASERDGDGDGDDAPGLVLTTDDGKEIDVAAVPADGAEGEETMGMLAKMQAQVAAHMARLMAGRR